MPTSLMSTVGLAFVIIIGYLFIFSEAQASVVGHTGCAVVVHERDDSSLYVDHVLQLARFKRDTHDGSLYSRINTVRCKAVAAAAGYEVGLTLSEKEQELIRNRIRNYRQSGFPRGFQMSYGGGSPMTSPGYFLHLPFTPNEVDPQYQENPGFWSKFVSWWHRVVLFFWTPSPVMYF